MDLIFLLRLYIGFPTFQSFQHFSYEYSYSSILAARLIYLLSAVISMLRLQVSVFSVLLLSSRVCEN